MSVETIQILAIVMGLITWVLSMWAIIPQMIAFHKTRNTSGVSWLSLAAICLDNVLWIVWAFGYYFNSMKMYEYSMTRLFQVSLIVLLWSYIFGSVLVLYTLLFKISHVIKAKQLKVSELQLAKILLDKDRKKYFVNKKWSKKRYLIPILYIVLTAIIAFTVCAVMYVYAYIKPVPKTKEWIWVIVLSFVSSVIWEISCWPQFIKSVRKKDTTGLSLFWCVFSSVNCIVTFIYDFALSYNTGGFNFDMLFVLIFSAIIPNVGAMIVKIKNVLAAKKANMTEVEYTKKVLIPQLKAKKKNSH